jgi:hypothetical protein
MTRRQALGTVLLGGSVLLAVALPLSGVVLGEMGQEVIVNQGGGPNSRWTVSVADYTPNWPVVAPLLAAGLAGLLCLALPPYRRRG